MAPRKISIDLTFNELAEVVHELTRARDEMEYDVCRRDFETEKWDYLPVHDENGNEVLKDDGTVKTEYGRTGIKTRPLSLVEDVERKLAERARLGRLLGILTGEEPTEEPETLERVRAARRVAENEAAVQADA